MIGRKLFYLATAVVFTMAMASCSSTDQEMLDEIDGYIAQLDSMDNLQKSIPWDSIEIVPLTVKEMELQVKKFYQSDTVDEALARKMNRWKGVRKSLGKASRAKGEFTVEIPEMRKQFKDLRADVENQAAPSKKLREDLNNEVARLNALKTEFKGFYELQRAEYQNYHELLPVVDSLINALQNRNE